MSKYIIEVDDNAVASANGCYTIVGTNNVLVSPNGLDGLEKYEETEDTVKENPFPQLGDRYFLIFPNGEIDSSRFEKDSYDINRMSIGNCFRTKEEAEFAVERLKVFAEMKKFAEPSDTKFDGEKGHYYINYNIVGESLDVGAINTMRCGELYFKSYERARECINVVGEDRIKKFYIGIE